MQLLEQTLGYSEPQTRAGCLSAFRLAPRSWYACKQRRNQLQL